MSSILLRYMFNKFIRGKPGLFLYFLPIGLFHNNYEPQIFKRKTKIRKRQILKKNPKKEKIESYEKYHQRRNERTRAFLMSHVVDEESL